MRVLRGVLSLISFSVSNKIFRTFSTISLVPGSILFTQQNMAQKVVPYFGEIEWITGYANKISGEDITYFSAYPDYATIALLTRCTDGKKMIEWETAPVPKKIKGSYVYFRWVADHSSGTSKGNRNFDLFVNDQKLLRFTTTPDHQTPNWSFAAADSSRIVFEQTNFRWKKIQPSEVINTGTRKNISAKEPITLAGMGILELKIFQ